MKAHHMTLVATLLTSLFIATGESLSFTHRMVLLEDFRNTG